MNLILAFVVLVSVLACAPVTPPASAVKATPTLSLYQRIPGEVGEFKLRERATVEGMPSDSLFRFSDDSRARITVIIYDVPPDVMAGPDSQAWTPREGAKFKAVLDDRVRRRLISEYVLSIADTTTLPTGDRKILEFRMAVPTRHPNGAITVETLHLYLIDGKFVKVRATIPEPGWQQSRALTFGRDFALRLVDSRAP